MAKNHHFGLGVSDNVSHLIFQANGLKSEVPSFFGSDSNRVIDRGNEYLAVACLPGASGGDDRLDRPFHEAISQDDFDLDLRLEIDGVLAAAVNFHVSLLSTEPFDRADGETVDPKIGERFFDLFQFEWLNDGFDSFHKRFPWGARGVQPVKPTGRATSGNSNMGKEECSGNVEFPSFGALRRERDGRAGR